MGGEPQAGGVSQPLAPPLSPGLPRSPKPYKARPSGSEQDRHKGGAPSQLDSAPLRAASQSGAGPGGGAQSQGRVGAIGRLTCPRRSRGRGATSQSAANCPGRDPRRVRTAKHRPSARFRPAVPGLAAYRLTKRGGSRRAGLGAGLRPRGVSVWPSTAPYARSCSRSS